MSAKHPASRPTLSRAFLLPLKSRSHWPISASGRVLAAIMNAELEKIITALSDAALLDMLDADPAIYVLEAFALASATAEARGGKAALEEKVGRTSSPRRSCHACHNPLSPTAGACPTCGARADPAPVPSPSQPADANASNAPADSQATPPSLESVENSPVAAAAQPVPDVPPPSVAQVVGADPPTPEPVPPAFSETLDPTMVPGDVRAGAEELAIPAAEISTEPLPSPEQPAATEAVSAEAAAPASGAAEPLTDAAAEALVASVMAEAGSPERSTEPVPTAGPTSEPMSEVAPAAEISAEPVVHPEQPAATEAVSAEAAAPASGAAEPLTDAAAEALVASVMAEAGGPERSTEPGPTAGPTSEPVSEVAPAAEISAEPVLHPEQPAATEAVSAEAAAPASGAAEPLTDAAAAALVASVMAEAASPERSTEPGPTVGPTTEPMSEVAPAAEISAEPVVHPEQPVTTEAVSAEAAAPASGAAEPLTDAAAAALVASVMAEAASPERSTEPVPTVGPTSEPMSEVAPAAEISAEPVLHPEQPVTTEARFFYAIGKEKRGPVSLEALSTLAAKGEVDFQTQVWEPGMAAWSALGTIPSICASLPPPLDTPEAPAWAEAEPDRGAVVGGRPARKGEEGPVRTGRWAAFRQGCRKRLRRPGMLGVVVALVAAVIGGASAFWPAGPWGPGRKATVQARERRTEPFVAALQRCQSIYEETAGVARRKLTQAMGARTPGGRAVWPSQSVQVRRELAGHLAGAPEALATAEVELARLGTHADCPPSLRDDFAKLEQIFVRNQQFFRSTNATERLDVWYNDHPRFQSIYSRMLKTAAALDAAPGGAAKSVHGHE